MFCPKCGNKNTTKFCTSCGYGPLIDLPASNPTTNAQQNAVVIKRTHKFKSTIILFFIILLLIAVIILLLKKPFGNSLIKDETKLSVITLKEAVEPASELVTSKYIYKDLNTYEDSKKIKNFKLPFTTDKLYYTYTGTICVGIDINELDFKINKRKETITVKMPKTKIISHELNTDDFEAFNIKDSIFTKFDLGKYKEIEGECKKAQEEKLLDNKDFMDMVDKNTEDTLESFLKASAITKGYDIEFEYSE